MNQSETNRFNTLYERQQKKLKLQGKPTDLENHFADLVESHSWSTVKIDRLGLQHFYKFVLKREWKWVDIVKPPKVKTIPDILSAAEVEMLIGAT